MITTEYVSNAGDKALEIHRYVCADVERGYRCRVSIFDATDVRSAKDRAAVIAAGHFEAKARAEAKALL